MTALGIALACGAMWVLAPYLRHWLIAAAISILLVGALSLGVWTQLLRGYPNDSFWTLDAAARAGVAAIGVGGIAVFYAALWGVTRKLAGAARVIAIIAGGTLGCAVMLSLAPQIFYALYQTINPGLPRQWVIRGAFDLARLSEVIPLDQRGNLSAHLAGIALWGVWPFAIWAWRKT